MDAVIDLDLAPPPLAPDERRPRFPRRTAVILAAILLVTLCAGSARGPVPTAGVIIPAAESYAAYISQGRLLVTDRDASSTGQTVRIYRLPDGRYLSKATLPPTLTAGNMLIVGDTIIVSSPTSEGADDHEVTALSQSTGAKLWRMTGTPVAATRDLVFVVSGVSDSGVAVDLRTGTWRWSMPLPQGGELRLVTDAAGQTRWVAAIMPDGSITAYDVQSGKVVGRRKLASQEIIFGTLTASVALAGDDGLAVYGLPGLEKRWVSHDGELTEGFSASDCGPGAVCAFRRPRGVTVIDERTGRDLWSSDQWGALTPSQGYLLAQEDAGASLELARLTVLDPASGRTIGDLGGWRAVENSTRADLRYAVYLTEGGAYFGTMDLARARVDVQGYAAGVNGSCQAGDGVLMCHRVDGAIGLYPLR